MDMENQKKSKTSESAKKKRYLILQATFAKGQTLSRSELKELEKFKSSKLPTGVVDTQKNLAKVLGVSTRTVQYWDADGLPKNKQGFYDLKMVEDWRFSKKNPKEKKGTKKEKDYETEYRKFKSKLAEMEYKEKSGQLVPARDVERDSVRKIVVIKQKFLALPRVIAPQLMGISVRKIEEVLRLRIEEIIDDFAQGRIEVKTKKKK